MSKFLKVKCPKCKNEQVIFGSASTKVKCLICGESLLNTKGGKSEITAKIVEPL
jgi:small subunit ribosomal protein S27e